MNTTIQGSAADIVKAAMVSMDKALRFHFPRHRPTLTHLQPMLVQHQPRNGTDIRGCDAQDNREATKNDGENFGAHLVLQLHDELMYEVGVQMGADKLLMFFP